MSDNRQTIREPKNSREKVDINPGIYLKSLPPQPWLNFELPLSGNSMSWNTCYFINLEILEIELENWWAKFRDPEKYHWQGERSLLRCIFYGDRISFLPVDWDEVDATTHIKIS